MNYKFLKRKIYLTLLISLILIFTEISCVTTKEEVIVKPKTVLIEQEERMFWEIKRGNSSVFVLGTVHVADKNFYPIEENILKVFDSSDLIYSEIGGLKEIQALPEKMQTKVLSCLNSEPEKNLRNFLSKEEVNLLYKELGQGNISPLFSFDPWVLSLVIPDMINQKNGFNPAYGIDLYFMARAKDKKIEAFETIESQFDILASGSFDEQLKRLYESIDSLKNYNQTVEDMKSLKKAYLENDKKAVERILTERKEIEKGMTAEDYDKYMRELLINRNIAWAKKIDELLGYGTEPKKVFVFAGVAHFIGENSVFEFLLKENYNNESL